MTFFEIMCANILSVGMTAIFYLCASLLLLGDIPYKNRKHYYSIFGAGMLYIFALSLAGTIFQNRIVRYAPQRRRDGIRLYYDLRNDAVPAGDV